MTVFDNLAFPLRNRGWSSAQLRQRVEEVADILELRADLARARACVVRGPEAEDLARPRTGAPRRRGGAVRRAADGDRSAPEVAAAPQAQADPPAAQALAAVRHARPDRSADVRRPGRGDEPGRDRAGRHARAAVRNAGAPLRRTLHRLARHELPACEWRGGAATIAGVRVETSSAQAPPRARGRSRSACGPSTSSSRDAGPESRAGARRCDRRIRASTRWCDSKWARRSRGRNCAAERDARRRQTRSLASAAARCALYADERRVP